MSKIGWKNIDQRPFYDMKSLLTNIVASEGKQLKHRGAKYGIMWWNCNTKTLEYSKDNIMIMLEGWCGDTTFMIYVTSI